MLTFRSEIPRVTFVLVVLHMEWWDEVYYSVQVRGYDISQRSWSIKMAPSKGLTLHHTDFPVYSVQSLGDRYFLVAGGGGQSRTGVKNIIVRYFMSTVPPYFLSPYG